MARRYQPASRSNRVTKPLQRKTRRSVEQPQTTTSGVSDDISHLPSPPSDEPSKKRKRRDSSVEPPCKKSKSIPPGITTRRGSDHYGSEVDWKEYYPTWPLVAHMDTDLNPMRGRRGSGKRALSRTGSYSQSVRDGDSPPPWTRQHEERMHEAGLVMKEYQTQANISEECRSLCKSLVNTPSLPPTGPSFESDRLLKILDLVRFRNEARIVRDIMPFVVPSAELLHVDGHPGLEIICEAMDAEWTQCMTLCGPRPKPDFVAGVAPAAFTSEEIEKLRMNHSSACPNLFPENMYYPFLLCEVKGSDRPIQEAERQSMHSASIAVQAIVQLYRKISAIEEINRKILAFSVAHNNSEVKIFGHFASVGEESTKYFRHRVYVADVAADFASSEWYKSYNVIRAIYDKFFPAHIQRIKSALSRLRARAVESFTSELALEDNSQDSAASFTSSQEHETFKRPALPSTRRAEQENERLRKQFTEMLRSQELKDEQRNRDRQEQAALMERQMAQQKEMMERQMEQQREESREQKVTMERQMAQQKEMMERQMEQQREESREQKVTMERQMEQQREIIDLLKQARS